MERVVIYLMRQKVSIIICKILNFIYSLPETSFSNSFRKNKIHPDYSTFCNRFTAEIIRPVAALSGALTEGMSVPEGQFHSSAHLGLITRIAAQLFGIERGIELNNKEVQTKTGCKVSPLQSRTKSD